MNCSFEVYQQGKAWPEYKCAIIAAVYGAYCLNGGWAEWAGWVPGWEGVIHSQGWHWINQFTGWQRHCREAIYVIHGSDGSWSRQGNPNGPETCWAQ
jgi:hypothetical protein